MSLITGPVCNGTPINWIAYLVVGIEQEVKKEPFRVCLMLQNHVVQENKRHPVFPRIEPFCVSSFIFIRKELEIGTISKNMNGANMFRISRVVPFWVRHMWTIFRE